MSGPIGGMEVTLRGDTAFVSVGTGDLIEAPFLDVVGDRLYVAGDGFHVFDVGDVTPIRLGAVGERRTRRTKPG